MRISILFLEMSEFLLKNPQTREYFRNEKRSDEIEKIKLQVAPETPIRLGIRIHRSHRFKNFRQALFYINFCNH